MGFHLLEGKNKGSTLAVIAGPPDRRPVEDILAYIDSGYIPLKAGRLIVALNIGPGPQVFIDKADKIIKPDKTIDLRGRNINDAQAYRSIREAITACGLDSFSLTQTRTEGHARAHQADDLFLLPHRTREKAVEDFTIAAAPKPMPAEIPAAAEAILPPAINPIMIPPPAYRPIPFNG